MYSVIFLFIGVIQAAVTYGTPNNCFACAKQNYQQNIFCWQKAFIDPWEVKCCTPGEAGGGQGSSSLSGISACQSSQKNICSTQSYKESNFEYFTHCPLINGTACGVRDSDENNTISADYAGVKEDRKTFSHQRLRYKDAQFKVPSYDVCYYKVQNPLYTFKSGNVKIKFTKIEDGVDIYVTAGSDVRNMTQAMVPGNSTVKVDSEFTIDQSISYIITAVPKYNSYNTTYEFEYWTDATEKYPFYFTFYHQWFVVPKNGARNLYGAVAGAAAVLICILFSLGCCIRKVCCKSKVDVEKTPLREETAVDEFLKNKRKNQTDDDDDENIQMESMVGGSEQSNHTTEGAGDRKITKNKKQDINYEYTNPFRQQNIEGNKTKQQKMVSNKTDDS